MSRWAGGDSEPEMAGLAPPDGRGALTARLGGYAQRRLSGASADALSNSPMNAERGGPETNPVPAAANGRASRWRS
jgi:hypothetical protein